MCHLKHFINACGKAFLAGLEKMERVYSKTNCEDWVEIQKSIEKYGDRSYNGCEGQITDIEKGDIVSRRKGKKKQRNNKGLSIVAFVVVAFCLILFIRTMNLKQQSEELEEKKAAVEKQIAQEEQRTKDLEELEKYMQTKKYMEEVAKEKLGLVYPGEILIQPENE